MENRVHYYTNPAFCQKSEFYPAPDVYKTPMREDPVGANGNSPRKPERRPSQRSSSKHRYEVVEMDEEEMEMNKRIINAMKMEAMSVSKGKYIGRYETVAVHENMNQRVQKVIPNTNQHEDVEVTPGGRLHRYAVIPTDDENEDYEEREIDVQKGDVRIPNQHNRGRYDYPVENLDQNGNSPQKSELKKPVPAPRTNVPRKPSFHIGNASNAPTQSAPTRYNPIATQKLHELITTPRKTRAPNSNVTPNKIQQPRNIVDTSYGPTSLPIFTPINQPQLNYSMASQQLRRPISPNFVRDFSNVQQHQVRSQRSVSSPNSRCTSPTATSASFVNSSYRYASPPITPQKLISAQNTPLKVQRMSPISPKAQQKLNYNLPNKFNARSGNDRSMAVIPPISRRSEVYSETTSIAESDYKIGVGGYATRLTLAAATLMTLICGLVTAVLSLYMISLMGKRLYYLDFAVVSGVICFTLGMLGFRSRNRKHWLPNRNYISGYILLSALSLMGCAGLAVILACRPRTGSPLADITSGAVCGVSALAVALAAVGVAVTKCCSHPPPDDRVDADRSVEY